MTNKLATLGQLTHANKRALSPKHTHTHTQIAFLSDERIKTREFFN